MSCLQERVHYLQCSELSAVLEILTEQQAALRLQCRRDNQGVIPRKAMMVCKIESVKIENLRRVNTK